MKNLATMYHEKALRILQDIKHQPASELHQRLKEANIAAYNFEIKAAKLTKEEPTRSERYTTAGWMAFDSGQHHLAIHCANESLSGNINELTKLKIKELKKVWQHCLDFPHDPGC